MPMRVGAACGPPPPDAAIGSAHGRCGRAPPPQQQAVVDDAKRARADEDERDFGLEDDRDQKSRQRDGPLQPVLHAHLGEPPARMKDERDNHGCDAIEDGGHPRQVAEMHVERTQQRDDDEVGRDERPSACPGAPETATHVGGEDADLDRQRSRHRLADRDGVTHFGFGEPASLVDQLSLHLAAQRHGAAETERAEPEEIADDAEDRDTALGIELRRARSLGLVGGCRTWGLVHRSLHRPHTDWSGSWTAKPSDRAPARARITAC